MPLIRNALKVLVGLSLSSSLHAADPSDLVTTVSASRPTYQLGEPVMITASICNFTNETISFYVGLTCEPYLEVLDSHDKQVAFAHCDGSDGAIRLIEHAAGECHDHEAFWPQTYGRFDHLGELGGPVGPGDYWIAYHKIYSPGPSLHATSEPFTIRAAVSIPALHWRGAVLHSVALALVAWRLLR